jgi:CelD/BcsL family acetyltransferase involved in cellulose biosynthesis
MKSKNIRSGFDSLFESRIIEFCRYYGLVSTVSVQGRIVAGAICYEVGNQAYLEAISHDPGYNRYNAGQVCLYLTVKHLIEKRRDSFHMLWGENEYKYRFLGVKQELYFISIYRSCSSKLSSMPKLIKHTCSYIFRQLDYLTKKYIINRYRLR